MCVNIDNWLEIINALGPVLTGSAIPYIAYQQLQISKKMRIAQQYERAISNCHQLEEAQSKAASHDYNKLQLALKELRGIRSEAQICLSKEVVDCIQNIINKALTIDGLRAKGQSTTSDETRKEFINEAFRLEVELGYEQPWQVYRKSLKID